MRFILFSVVLTISSAAANASLLHVGYNLQANTDIFDAASKSLIKENFTAGRGSVSAVSVASGVTYVGYNNSSIIDIFDSQGLLLRTIGLGSRSINAIAVSPSNYLYVGVSNSSSINKYDLNGQFLGGFANGSRAITGLTFDSLGNLYAGYSNSTTIDKFNLNGSKSAFTSGSRAVSAISFASDGLLYIGYNNSSAIDRYNPKTLFLERSAIFADGQVSGLGSDLISVDSPSLIGVFSFLVFFMTIKSRVNMKAIMTL